MSQLEQYRQYREHGRELHSKLFDEHLDRDTIEETARLLGFDGDDDTVTYETEEEQSVHMDFILHEYRQNGQTPVERYREDEGGNSERETHLLDAMVRSKTSLFRVTETDLPESRLILADVLNDEKGIELTDQSFSQTATTDVLLLLRLIRLDDVTMTSGLSFAFQSEVEDHLLTVYDQVLENAARPESIARFITFHKLHRKYGLDVQHV